MVLVRTASGKPSFCEVKVGFWLQNHLLRGKTKKPKKPSFLENGEGMLKKMFFLVSPRKKMVFHRKPTFPTSKDGFGLVCLWKTIFLRGKSLFLAPKPSFYAVKVGFCVQNHLFTWEKLVLLWKTIFLRGKTKKTLFFKIPSPFSKKDGVFGFLVLPRKRWFWSQKPTFTSQKDGFPEAVQTKTIFLRGKSWFSYEKPSFYEAKPKKTSFSTSPPHSLKKMVFFGFLVLPRKRWFWSQKPTFTSQKDGFGVVFLRKTIFLRGKNWFSYEKPSFYEAKPKKPSFSTSPPHSLKKMVFLVFWFCLVPLSGQNRSALHVAMLGGSLVLVSLILISAIAFLFLLM